MLKKDDVVIVKEVKDIRDENIINEVLKNTTWKQQVLNTNEEINLEKIYKVCKIKDGYVALKMIDCSEYFLIEEKYCEKIEVDTKIVMIKSYEPATKNLVGIVKDLGASTIGVDFGEDFNGHNLGGKLSTNTGYYVPANYIKNYNEALDLAKEENENLAKLTSKIEQLTETLEKKERFQDLMNEAVIEKGKEIAIEDLKEKLKSELDTFISEKYGVLPKQTIEIKEGDYKKKLDGIFHKEFENICRIVKSDIPLMLVGSAGAGKNYTLEQVAKALNLDFYFSNAVNQEYKLTGFIDANGKYHETEFYKAFTKGGMFFLDEIDASCPECLVILNSAIANRYFDFPTGRVEANENFRVVCAGNTYGTGADMVYVGRNVLDGATLDRFVVLPFDYDEEVEKQLAYDNELYTFIHSLREAINKAGLRYIVSMRALINSSKLLAIGMSKENILRTSIIKNMQIDDLNNVIKKIEGSSEWITELKKMCD